jgi:16S rRNA (cytidine1402-2'-O)-methyltransferase
VTAKATSGKLYLIPTTLGDGDLDRVIPQPVQGIIRSLDTFIVEHPKTARLFLKQVGTAIPVQEIRMLTLDEHTKPRDLLDLLQPVLLGKDVGLMSEAGCPAVADPGANLVRLAHEKNVRVVPLVGPSSILLALMGSGLSGQCFAFQGYVPVEKEARRKRIAELESESRNKGQTQIFIEAPYRNQQLLQAIVEACDKNTRLCVATDLTLATEDISTRTVGEWRNNQPDINKRPSIFLLYVG